MGIDGVSRNEPEVAGRDEGQVSRDDSFWNDCSSSFTLHKVWQNGPTYSSMLLTSSRYLDAWKAGDYPSSFDHLHRYFDYTMQSKDRTFYQYALLNLAILQADYGCFSEAVAAMHETISTARENKDSACLNYSLSWLFHFSKAHPEELDNVRQAGVLGTDREALSFLKAKARDAGMWSLLSTTLLAEARQCQLNVCLYCIPVPTVLTISRARAWHCRSKE